MGGGCCVQNHPILDAIKDMFCRDSCCVGNTGSSNRESANHATKVASELADKKAKTETTAKMLEEKIIEHISVSMDKFLKEISKFNNRDYYGEKLSINISLLQRKNEELNSKVKGSIMQVMNRRLVQSDPELKLILEEKDDGKRKNNFDNFVKGVRKTALSHLGDEITNVVSEQEKLVEEEITNRMNEIKAKIDDTYTELKEIEITKKKSENELEQKQINLKYKLDLLDLFLNELEM